ncbi:Expressed protein [Arabidopsis thaliana]|jgi:hypothetical protein|uniref:At1g45165 n=1 Tax=Arabidopsis thaliana TaxID=3702 RepID=Q058G8_ARATH|nr:uncharacterized protein AT1G45165 [Arabidopsis thaliana]ABJ98582.1 At1g45165 [Arabidopsis thaliana]AEE32088.1 Expressed protein [Arabidopsis thaliana]|eukprot:NP_973973.1 Expressed protein [Arabidopsis thaliana]
MRKQHMGKRYTDFVCTSISNRPVTDPDIRYFGGIRIRIRNRRIRHFSLRIRIRQPLIFGILKSVKKYEYPRISGSDPVFFIIFSPPEHKQPNFTTKILPRKNSSKSATKE